MPSFAYTVRDATGTVHRGVSEAENDAILARRLKEQGLEVQSIKKTKTAVKPGQKRIWGGIKLTELSIFCRQFSTMIDAGVSLVRCLSVLQEQSASAKMKYILSDIQSEVEAGQTLSKAMAK